VRDRQWTIEIIHGVCNLSLRHSFTNIVTARQEFLA